MAQLVKNLPTMQETQVEDPLEEGMATHSSIPVLRVHGQRSLVGYSPWCRKQSDMTEQLTHTHICIHTADSLFYTVETKTTLQNNYTPIKVNLKNKDKDETQRPNSQACSLVPNITF